MEKLILERSQAVQGEPVKVYVSGSRGHCGEFIVTFEEWIHFSKLIKEGTENLKRKNEQRIEVLIKGLGDKEPKKKEDVVITSIPVISSKKLDAEVDELMAGMVKPEEGTKQIVNNFTEVTNGLVRSLIREGDKNESE